jgi:hypothetical protein
MHQSYELAIAYRIYPRVSKIPAMYPQDKLRLARLCLRSFRESLGSLSVKMFVLLDGCPPEFEAIFAEHFDSPDLELIRLNGIGNRQTFSLQIDTLLNQDCAEAVYFAEDDYFYLPGQFAAMLQFLKENPDADFVSPYDHPDYYRLPIHSELQDTRQNDAYTWRTAASTCLTFLTTKETLARTQRIFKTYSLHNPDVCLWMSLTKQAVLNPHIILQSFQKKMSNGAFVAISWLYGWPQILGGRKRKLWVPHPAIATHMDQSFLAPGVDWNLHFQSTTNSL